MGSLRRVTAPICAHTHTHTQNTHIRKYSGMRYPEKLYLVSSKSSFHYNMSTYFNNCYIIYQKIAGFRTIYSVLYSMLKSSLATK